MRDIHCPKDIGFENTFSGEDCEKEQHYNNCYHCWSTALARRKAHMTLLEQESVLDRVRSEVENIEIAGHIRDIECFNAGINTVLNVIDKYKTEWTKGNKPYSQGLYWVTANEAGKIKMYDDPMRYKDGIWQLDGKNYHADNIIAHMPCNKPSEPYNEQADTVAGEIARAICRIEYRWLNDGDRLGEGYGRETCNPSGRYLAETCDEKVAEAVYGAWRTHNDMEYEAGLDALEEATLEYLEAHPELETEKNEQDSRTVYYDPDQDVDEYEKDDED